MSWVVMKERRVMQIRKHMLKGWHLFAGGTALLMVLAACSPSSVAPTLSAAGTSLAPTVQAAGTTLATEASGLGTTLAPTVEAAATTLSTQASGLGTTFA